MVIPRRVEKIVRPATVGDIAKKSNEEVNTPERVRRISRIQSSGVRYVPLLYWL